MAKKPAKLGVVSGTALPATTPKPRPEEAHTPGEWLSHGDFVRTLELVDRTCRELKASEARLQKLTAKYEELEQHTEGRLEAAQEQIRSLQERAAQAEEWARHLKDRAARAEARAIEAEERADALEEWADNIQAVIEETDRGS